MKSQFFPGPTGISGGTECSMCGIAFVSFYFILFGMSAGLATALASLNTTLAGLSNSSSATGGILPSSPHATRGGSPPLINSQGTRPSFTKQILNNSVGAIS